MPADNSVSDQYQNAGNKNLATVFWCSLVQEHSYEFLKTSDWQVNWYS